MNSIAVINGAPVDLIDVHDRGFQYGDGVFTTIRVERGRCLFLDEHLHRLSGDGFKLSIPAPDFVLLRSEVECEASIQQNGIIKVILTRGIGGRGYRCPVSNVTTRVILKYPSTGFPLNFIDSGVSVRLCSMRLGHNPVLAGVKHLNRLEQVLARREWGGDDIQEGLVMDQDAFVVEGTMSNIFLVRSGHLITPRLDRCGVNGVMRSIVISIAKDLKIPLREDRIPLSDIKTGDELFLTNSIIGIWPVRNFDEKSYESFVITKRLLLGLNELISLAIGKS